MKKLFAVLALLVSAGCTGQVEMDVKSRPTADAATVDSSAARAKALERLGLVLSIAPNVPDWMYTVRGGAPIPELADQVAQLDDVAIAIDQVDQGEAGVTWSELGIERASVVSRFKQAAIQIVRGILSVPWDAQTSPTLFTGERQKYRSLGDDNPMDHVMAIMQDARLEPADVGSTPAAMRTKVRQYYRDQVLRFRDAINRKLIIWSGEGDGTDGNWDGFAYTVRQADEQWQIPMSELGLTKAERDSVKSREQLRAP